ncbi:hypothetical protein [Hymenobacter chitinivorans]|uniref:Lipoprotein n=1 Tax=Hymenobacter chitinivorans DSM 11115 TaxID=1121954 RepID=A0A2M9B4A0_9BACT|nr:hypothetical protein [Hymenobacter chitinivorans]PJJ52790.1 hypothetical protein CLV45_3447 [Hymenobacter chitinivorans DSM 11115]
MTKNLLLSAVAVATLALNACSSEPSDLRPEAKVSVDQVAPGTRSSDNFDLGTEHEPNQAKGGAIAAPISSDVEFEKDRHPNAEAARSANGEAEDRTKAKEAAPAPAETLHDNDEKPAEKMKEE